MTTVNTIKGQPHTQPMRQFIGASERKLRAAPAILIQTFLNAVVCAALKMERSYCGLGGRGWRCPEPLLGDGRDCGAGLPWPG
jgi:hypothetical protein